MSDLIGLTIGGYKILSVLGRGGMGVVFLGESPEGKVLAVKIVEEAPGIQAESLNRVRLEVEAAKTLRGHPHIMEVLDSGIDHGKHFIVMPRYIGWRGYRSLSDLIQRGAVTQRQALDLGVKIARALDFAHSKGLVHRDVKPSNILLTEDGQPVVSDFGLVLMDGGRSVTQTPRGLGTAYYMSPEQARGDEFLDGRADIYSLGVVLYELLTDGQMPYLRLSSTTAQVFKDILEGNVRPLRKVRKDIGRDVEAVVMKCLELDRRRRYLSGEALARDLENCLAGTPVAASTVSPLGSLARWASRRKPLAAALAGALVLGLAASAAFFLYVSQKNRERPGLQLVFQDDFSRPDGKDEGPSWWDKDGSSVIKDGALRIRNGWIALLRKIPGDLRLEFDGGISGDNAPGELGAFINGVEGHWNGYAAWFSGPRGAGSELTRLNALCLAGDKRPVQPGKVTRYFLERRGNRILMGAGGRTLLEYLDLDPLAEDKYGRLGLICTGTDGWIDNVKAFVYAAAPRVSPMESGDALWRRRDAAGALREYSRVLGSLAGEEREVCGLKIGRAFTATGKDAEAFKWYKDMGSWKLSRLGRRRLAAALAGSAGALALWNDHLAQVREVMTDSDAGAEQQDLIRALANFDSVWKRRALWEGRRFSQVWELYTSRPEIWARPSSCRVLFRFARILGHPEEALALAKTLIHESRGEGEVRAHQAEALWILCGDLQQKGNLKAAREIWEREAKRLKLGENGYYDTRNFPVHEVDRLYGKDGRALEALFDSGLGRDRKENAPWAYQELAMAVWGRNDEKLAQTLFKKVQKAYPSHGVVVCSGLLNLAAMDLWNGKRSGAARTGQRIASEFPAELWAQPLARLLQGRINPKDWVRGTEREEGWQRTAAGPRLAAAAYFRALDEKDLCRQELEFIQALTFPWEDSHLIASRWLKELGRG